MVSAHDIESCGPMFESCWRKNSDDCTALSCTEPFIITLLSSQYNLKNVERDVKTENRRQILFFS